MTNPVHIGFLIYPGVTLLDFAGPAQVLSMVPGAVIHTIWKDTRPVMTDAGIAVTPTDSLEREHAILRGVRVAVPEDSILHSA